MDGKRVRLKKPKRRPGRQWIEELPLDPRDPDVLRVKTSPKAAGPLMHEVAGVTTWAQKGTRDAAAGQGCGGRRSRRRHRRRGRRRLCVRGATLLTGRKLAPVEAVAKDIVAAGGAAEAAEVDALDEQAIDQHLQSVIDQAGHLNLSFNAVGVPDAKIVGVPLVELDAGQFNRPGRCAPCSPGGGCK